MIIISSFNSVMEFGAALHLAFSLIDEIHSRPVVMLRREKEVIEPILATASEADAFWIREGMRLIESNMAMKRSEIERVSARCRRLCILIAILCTAFLVVSGFCPNLAIGYWGAVALCSVAILPMPVCLVCIYRVCSGILKEQHGVRTKVYGVALKAASQATRGDHK